jgi:hypothetical protein
MNPAKPLSKASNGGLWKEVQADIMMVDTLKRQMIVAAMMLLNGSVMQTAL